MEFLIEAMCGEMSRIEQKWMWKFIFLLVYASHVLMPEADHSNADPAMLLLKHIDNSIPEWFCLGDAHIYFDTPVQMSSQLNLKGCAPQFHSIFSISPGQYFVHQIDCLSHRLTYDQSCGGEYLTISIPIPFGSTIAKCLSPHGSSRRSTLISTPFSFISS